MYHYSMNPKLNGKPLIKQITKVLVDNTKEWNHYEEKFMIKMLMKMCDKSFSEHSETWKCIE